MALRAITVLAAVALASSGCAVVAGYPAELEDSKSVLKSLKPYFDPSEDDTYSKETDATRRQAKRDVLVLSRMRAFDIQFSDYEKSL
jgi:hypothetical protein